MINPNNKIIFNPYQEDFILYDLPEELDLDPDSPTFNQMVKPQTFPCMESSWGTGKTLSAIAKGLMLHKESPNNLGMILRKEVTDLRDSTMRDFETITDTHINTQTKDVEVYGGVIMFRHASQLDEAVLQNVNLGWFWIEQADELLTDYVFWLLQGRLRRKGKRQTGFLTANSGCSWIAKLYPLGTKDKYSPLFRAISWDNKHNLPKATLSNWYRMRLHKPDMYKQYVMNSRDIMTGAIWPGFNDKYHIIADIEIPKDWEIYRIWDMGTSGVVASLWVAVDMEGNLIFFKEYYESNKNVDCHANKVNEMNGDMQIRLDYSCSWAFARTQATKQRPNPFALADEYKDYGIILNPTPEGVEAGIDRVANLLIVDEKKIHPFKKGLMGCPKIFICKSLKHTIQQMEEYRRIEKVTDTDFKQVTVNKDSHTCECVRRFALTRPSPSEVEVKIKYNEWGEPPIDVMMDNAVTESKKKQYVWS